MKTEELLRKALKDLVKELIQEVQEESGLKPCPFCGGTATLHKYIFEEELWGVSCDNIDCGLTQTKYFSTEKEARDAWNRRWDSNDKE